MSRRGRPPHPDILTPREWEVLALLREGLSNPEIAQRLGISPAGARYHVSEIMGKLAVESREEAARWRRVEERRPWWTAALLPVAALWRKAGALPVGLSTAAAVVSGGLLVAALAGLGLIAFLLVRADDEEGPRLAADSTAVAEPPSPPPVVGLFTEPRPTMPDVVLALVEDSRLSFQAWNGISTVLYDTLTGEETDLGEGSLGVFSPDGAKLAWTAGPFFESEEHEAWTRDLSTMESRPIGPGRVIGFVDNERIKVQIGAEDPELVDLRTGEREPANGVPLARDFGRIPTSDGYELQRTRIDDFEHNTYVLMDVAAGDALLKFEAYQALPAGPGNLVVATPPQNGTTNIFIVDIDTGQAVFIATSAYSPPNWPLAANADYVMWTEDYCGLPPGKTRRYDRRSASLEELDATLWATFSPDGLIAAGEFGARTLIDPETLEVLVAVPDRGPGADLDSGSDVSWSPDYRYFTRGFSGGHGGLCRG